jgi:uncharacterized membrane protein YfcA
MNATASVFFVAGGLIYWKDMAVLLVFSTIGGYLAGHYGRRLDPGRARIVISCLNAIITAVIFWRRFG